MCHLENERQSVQGLHPVPERQFPFAAILLLEIAPQESFTGAHENLPRMPKNLPGRFLALPARWRSIRRPAYAGGAYIVVYVCAAPVILLPPSFGRRALPTHHLHGMMSTWNIDIQPEIRHHGSMRTTLSLDDEVLRLVKRYAESRSLGLGKAVSELVRRGLTAQRPTRTVNGLRVFDLPADSPPVTRKKIEEIESDDE